MIAPTTAPVMTIIRHAQVKMLLASSSCPWPRWMEIGTEEPTPIRSASAKLMMTNGIARLSAANAVAERSWPTSMPSISWYSADASMLIEPGSAAKKNSFSGGVLT